MGNVNAVGCVVFLWFPSRDLKKESEDEGFGGVFTACVIVSPLCLHMESQRM